MAPHVTAMSIRAGSVPRPILLITSEAVRCVASRRARETRTPGEQAVRRRAEPSSECNGSVTPGQ